MFKGNLSFLKVQKFWLACIFMLLTCSVFCYWWRQLISILIMILNSCKISKIKLLRKGAVVLMKSTVVTMFSTLKHSLCFLSLVLKLAVDICYIKWGKFIWQSNYPVFQTFFFPLSEARENFDFCICPSLWFFSYIYFLEF